MTNDAIHIPKSSFLLVGEAVEICAEFIRVDGIFIPVRGGRVTEDFLVDIMSLGKPGCSSSSC